MVYQVSQLLTVMVWQRILLGLDNLEDKSKEIVGLERLCETAQLIDYDSQGPDITLR